MKRENLIVLELGVLHGNGHEKYRLPLCDRVPGLPFRAAVRFALGSHDLIAAIFSAKNIRARIAIDRHVWWRLVLAQPSW